MSEEEITYQKINGAHVANAIPPPAEKTPVELSKDRFQLAGKTLIESYVKHFNLTRQAVVNPAQMMIDSSLFNIQFDCLVTMLMEANVIDPVKYFDSLAEILKANSSRIDEATNKPQIVLANGAANR
jgi:hypothetical protein